MRLMALDASDATSTYLYFAPALVQKDLMLSTANIHGNSSPGLSKDATLETTGDLLQNAVLFEKVHGEVSPWMSL